MNTNQYQYIDVEIKAEFDERCSNLIAELDAKRNKLINEAKQKNKCMTIQEAAEYMQHNVITLHDENFDTLRARVSELIRYGAIIRIKGGVDRRSVEDFVQNGKNVNIDASMLKGRFRKKK